MKYKIPIICTVIVIAELAAGLLYIIYDKSCALFANLNQKNNKIKCQNKLCPHYRDCDISAYSKGEEE